MAFAIRLLFACFRLLPVRLAGAIGAGIGRTAFLLVRRHRMIAIGNLSRIYPDKPRAWRNRTARESFAELGRTVFELPHVFLQSKAFLSARVDVEGEAAFREAMEAGDGVFLAACHHSNWEMGALMLSLLGYDATIIYRPIDNPELESYLKQCRERFGAHMQSRWEGLRWLPKALKRGSAIAVMIDQHMSQGIQVPFLGHMANTTALPATFVLRQQTPVFGVALERHGRDFRFTLRFWRIDMPEASDDKTTDTYEIMRHICDSFAPIIHARPELWLWLHRRWFILEHDPEMAKVVHGTP
jgi:KDO2-lipid IV(A) lauroyltransferase